MRASASVSLSSVNYHVIAEFFLTWRDPEASTRFVSRFYFPISKISFALTFESALQPNLGHTSH